MDDTQKGHDGDLERELDAARRQRDELQRSLEIANAERAELRLRLGRLERGDADVDEEESSRRPTDPARGPRDETAKALGDIRATLEEAKRERRALTGLISDAADVHRVLRSEALNSPTRPSPGSNGSLRGRLARTRLAAPARAVRARRRRRAAQKTGAAGEDGDQGRGEAPVLSAPGRPSRLSLAGPAVAVEVHDLAKAFRVPSHHVDSLKERLVRHPFRRVEQRRMEVLRGVDFTVRQGEFVGVVGTNGAGKSTLLKAIAGIYQADSGSVRVAGRVAPLIELGVGFRADLSAHDNVILSASMLGLSPERARERYPAVLEFAGLEEFAELKLRNYSSGMRVRLAFAVMMQVEADVFLIDEVLAVGDAPFQERCTSALKELQAAGKTILFVSHSMPKVRATCDRAILLVDGKVTTDGDPDGVASRYEELMEERRKAKRFDRLPQVAATGESSGA